MRSWTDRLGFFVLFLVFVPVCFCPQQRWGCGAVERMVAGRRTSPPKYENTEGEYLTDTEISTVENPKSSGPSPLLFSPVVFSLSHYLLNVPLPLLAPWWPCGARPSILFSRPSTLALKLLTISRMCLTLSNSVSSSSIWRRISLNRAISASAAAMEVAARLDWEVVEAVVWAVSCVVRLLLADSLIWRKRRRRQLWGRDTGERGEYRSCRK